jgi:hypothetical protein
MYRSIRLASATTKLITASPFVPLLASLPIPMGPLITRITLHELLSQPAIQPKRYKELMAKEEQKQAGLPIGFSYSVKS